MEDSLTGVLFVKHAGCCVSALTRTFAAHELLGVGADFICCLRSKQGLCAQRKLTLNPRNTECLASGTLKSHAGPECLDVTRTNGRIEAPLESRMLTVHQF
jgi:hypothetical protein